jgi:hypothetical protein
MGNATLIADLQREHEQWKALLAEVGEARMDQPGVAGPWSVKDIVAHLAGWRRRTVGRFQAALRGEADPPPPWPAHLKTDDEINAWIYEQSRERSARQVLDDSEQLFQELVAAMEGIPEAELQDPGRFPWLEDQPLTAYQLFAHFHEEHEPDIRAWLARQEPPEQASA